MSENSHSSFARSFARLASLVAEPSWVVASFVAMSLAVISIIGSVTFLRDGSDSTVGQFGVGVSVYLLTLALVTLPIFIKRTKRYVYSVLGVAGWPTLKSFWLPLGLWPLYMLLSVVVGIVISTYVPMIDSNQAQDIGFKDINTILEYVLVFFALAVIPPIAEELLFRGYLFGRLREKFGFMLTTVVVSAVFGLVHGQWNVGIDVFILSLFLCYLREKTDSVWASIVLHSLKNTIAYLLLFIAPLLGFNLVQ